jgi:hypothetical protein
LKATYDALAATYGYLTPDLWQEYELTKSPIQEFSDLLSQPKIYEKKTQPHEEGTHLFSQIKSKSFLNLFESLSLSKLSERNFLDFVSHSQSLIFFYFKHNEN